MGIIRKIDLHFINLIEITTKIININIENHHPTIRALGNKYPKITIWIGRVMR
jgi:hypothetical protein